MAVCIFHSCKHHQKPNMKFILFLAALALGANADVDVEAEFDADADIHQPIALVETRNSGFDEQGHALYQGDMIMDEERLELIDGLSIEERKAIKPDTYRWPDADVPYRFDPSVTKYRSAILEGIKHWEANTCIRFREVPNTFVGPHLVFKDAGSCSATVGRRVGLTAGQPVSIGNGCNSMGTVAHEIGHALGFRHEQARTDRDDYVVVLWENIVPAMKHNFDIDNNTNNYGVAYDLSSIMHYTPDFFSTNNKNNLVTRDPLKHFLIGQRNALSFGDIKLANLMYNCAPDCGSQSTCSNGGFMGQNCVCVCPPEFSGATCRQRSWVSTEPACGGNVLEETTIRGSFPAQTKCVWVVRAPIGRRVQAEFKTYTFALPRNGVCRSGSLELRTNDLYAGTKYCGNELRGTRKTSVSNTMVFVYDTAVGRTGFQAEITFV